MKQYKFTKTEEQSLRDEVISLDKPGTILRDFEMLLEFVGSRPMEASGKYNLLPIKFISDLDQRLSRPLRLELKRPQIKSHPYIQGLNLLLRATGLCQVDGTGAKARLVLNPAMKLIWDRLNPTERYFNLLEAWLRHGDPEMIGERGGSFSSGMTWTILEFWEGLPDKGLKFDVTKASPYSIPSLYSQTYQLALMDLFGLVKVEHSPKSVTPWIPLSINHCLYGDATLALISKKNPMSKFLFDLQGLSIKASDETDSESEEPDFGVWQPLFQPYFPEWRDNLEFPDPEYQEGEFIFRMSHGKIWRRLAIPDETTMEELLHLILKSVEFDHDHLYAFTYRDEMGVSVSISDPNSDEGPWADEIEVGMLGLQPGQVIELLYDYGDSWKFQIKLERINPAGAKDSKPRILESHGKSPQQYESWDDEEEDEEE
jgi:hypothetical protein